MNKISKYTTFGICVFILAVVVAFVIIYASQTGQSMFLYAGVAVEVVLSLMSLIMLLQYGQAVKDSESEISRLKQRDIERLQRDSMSTKQTGENQTGKFNAANALIRILPARETAFSDVRQYADKILQNIAKELDIVQGLIFILNTNDNLFHVSGEYAYYSEEQPRSFPSGETLSGQVAKNKKILNVQDMPEGYITVLSGLGKGNPRHLIIAPVVFKGESIGIIELASFKAFDKDMEDLIEKIAGDIAGKLKELSK